MRRKLIAGALALALLALPACAVPRPGGAEYPLFESETKGAGMTDYCKTIVDFLGCEYEYFEFTMGEEIYARYEALAAQGRDEGFTPLIVIPTDTLAETFDVEFLSEVFDTGTTPQAIAAWREQAIFKAAQYDVDAYFRATQKRLEKSLGKRWMPKLGSFIPVWPNQGKPLSGSVRPEEEAVIVKIPARDPWALAVWMPIGGFDPIQQAAVFRYWYEKYGAAPVVAQGSDSWELQVDRPPQSDEDCEALAWEHFLFCTDIRPPLGNTIREIASHLRGATTWGFWWD